MIPACRGIRNGAPCDGFATAQCERYPCDFGRMTTGRRDETRMAQRRRGIQRSADIPIPFVPAQVAIGLDGPTRKGTPQDSSFNTRVSRGPLHRKHTILSSDRNDEAFPHGNRWRTHRWDERAENPVDSQTPGKGAASKMASSTRTSRNGWISSLRQSRSSPRGRARCSREDP